MKFAVNISNACVTSKEADGEKKRCGEKGGERERKSGAELGEVSQQTEWEMHL